MKRRGLWLLANLLMLLLLAGVVWATLLPVIWGPNPDADGEFPRRRARSVDR